MKGFIEVTSCINGLKFLININAIEYVVNNIIYFTVSYDGSVDSETCNESYEEIKELIKKAQEE